MVARKKGKRGQGISYARLVVAVVFASILIGGIAWSYWTFSGGEPEVDDKRPLSDFTIEEVTDDEVFERLVQREDSIFVYYFSPTCPYCVEAEPIITQVAEDTDVRIVKVNVSSSLSIAKKYSVKSVPSVVEYREGQEVKRIEGAQNYTNYHIFFTNSLERKD